MTFRLGGGGSRRAPVSLRHTAHDAPGSQTATERAGRLGLLQADT